MATSTFIHSSRFDAVDYGDEHPFKVLRYRLVFSLLKELGLLEHPDIRVVDCSAADETALLTFHRRDYLERLREFSRGTTPRADFVYGLGDVENPVFPGLYDWASLVCGGTLAGVEQILNGNCRAAFNVAGGWHHAHAARASGFSYLNDAVIGINRLLEHGLRVAYVDIDAHHGDGVQQAYYASDRVLTISIHETGDDFFPHTGYARELGEGAGYGYAINVPLLRHADDRLFRRAWHEVVLPALHKYRPDVLVAQMGVDSLRADPLARLEMTTATLEEAARSLATLGTPWLALGGGGYDKVNVARGWSLVWGIMSGQTVPDLLPPRFREELHRYGLGGDRLRDLPHLALEKDYLEALEALDGNLTFLHEHVPLLATTGNPPA